MTLIGKIIEKVKSILNEACFKYRNSGIHKSVTIKNSKLISIGKNCRIGKNSYLLCWREYAHGGEYQKLDSSLVIGDNFSATRNLTIQCCNRIIIGNNVLVGSNVFICDYNHGVDNVENSYRDNELVVDNVVIADGVWIGQGVYILPGVHIGKHSIIGAGSVVTKDVPDYCIAVGNPARVIKQFDHSSNRWHRIKQVELFKEVTLDDEI